MTININKVIIPFVLSALVSGCATIFSGTTQHLQVKVVDSAKHELLEGSVCSVIEGNGAEIAITSNPGVVTVKRGENISVVCKKAGYKQLNMAVGDSFNAVSVVNLICWPGFIVDGLSGAWKKYPSHYVVTMEKM
jgi:hypothetical protein